MPEIWREVPGWPGYWVSDIGNIRTEKRTGPRHITPRADRGYIRVRLWKNGRGHTRRIHQLVALAFIGPVPDGQEVRQIDGDRSNNRADNLTYGTSSENNLDKLVHGTHNMARKTHCLRGHLLDEQNTQRKRLRTGSVARSCRACARLRARGYRAKAREAVGASS